MKIFFVGYEQANVCYILPVLRALQRHPRLQPVFAPGTDFKEHRGLHTAAAPRGIAARHLDAALDTAELAAAERRGVALCRTARGWAADAADAAAPLTRVLAGRLQHLLGRRAMPGLFRTYARIERAAAALARREQPRLVVLSEDSDFLRGRLLARIFAAHGARVVCLTPWYYSTFDSYPLIGERRAHAYLVGTGAHARRLIAAGVPRRCVEVVGHPVFDALAADASPAPGHFLYALQGLPWDRTIAVDLLAAVAAQPGARLTIKPHPQLPLPAWLARLARRDHVRIAPARTAGIALLGDVRCVVAQTSRLLFEASLLGRDVIVPHYAATPLLVALPRRDAAAVVAASAAQLRQRVRESLAGRGRGLSRAAIAPHHPHATQRAVQALERLSADAR